MLKAFDLNADLPSLAILHKKASHPGGFFVSGVRVEPGRLPWPAAVQVRAWLG